MGDFLGAGFRCVLFWMVFLGAFRGGHFLGMVSLGAKVKMCLLKKKFGDEYLSITEVHPV